MGKKYTLQILTDKEFDSLPYKNVRESLGCADKAKGLAFVRNTGIKELDQTTLLHEIDELVEKHSNHEDEDGIRYKSGGSLGRILGPIIGAILTPFIGPGGPIVGGLISGGTTGYSQSKKPDKYGKPSFGSIGGATAKGAALSYLGGQAVGGGIAGGTAAKAGFLSKAGGIAKGALLGTPATMGGPATTSYGVSVPSTYVPPSSGLLGSGGAFLGKGTAASGEASGRWAAPSITGAPSIVGAPSAGVGGYANPNIQKVGAKMGYPTSPTAPPAIASTPAITPGVGTGAAAAGINAGKAASSAFSFKDLITPQNVIGAGSLLGAAGQQTPEFQMPDSVEQLRSKIVEGQGLSPLGTQARTSLSEILASQPSQINAPAGDEYFAETNRQIDLRYDEAKKSLDAAYNNAGMLNSGEHLDQVRRLEEARAEAKNAYVTSENQRRFEFGSNQKYNAIQSALGVDKNTMDDLIGLSGLDVQTAAMIYGAQVADITAIREALGTIGAETLLRGQGIQTGQGVNINIGGGQNV